VAAKLLPDDQNNGLVSEVMRFNDGPVIEGTESISLPRRVIPA
jgi:hypothetical protein